MGIGSAVYAASTDNGNGFFEQMLPTMKQMHPDLSDQQLKDMYSTCQKYNDADSQRTTNNPEFRRGMMGYQ